MTRDDRVAAPHNTGKDMRHLTSIRHFVARKARHVPFLRAVRRLITLPGDGVKFTNSEQYWKERYQKGGDSGEGSYGPLARYKASFINEFCNRNDMRSAIEFGCGDGHQASMLDIPVYLGVDISQQCVEWALKNLRKENWDFQVLDRYLASGSERFDLGLSLDVIYHLVEDDVYKDYLKTISESASRFLLIYASNLEYYDPQVPHVRHRAVVADIERRHPEWAFVRTEPNPLAIRPDGSRDYGSFADFHIFERRTA